MATKNLHTPQPATPARKRALSKSGQARERLNKLSLLLSDDATWLERAKAEREEFRKSLFGGTK